MALTLPKWLTSWADGGSKTEPSGGKLTAGYPSTGHPKPTGVEHNWLFNYAMNGLLYLARRGLPDWSSAYAYATGDVVRGSDGLWYEAVVNPTAGTSPQTSNGQWVPAIRGGLGLCGDGSDGDATISSDTTHTGEGNFNNLAINSGILSMVNGVLRVKGTLYIASGAAVRAGTVSGMRGADASGNTGGAGAIADNTSSSGTIFAGSSGGIAGDAGAGADATFGAAVIDSAGGTGGAGAAASSGVGTPGAGGTRTAVDLTKTSSLQQIAMNGGYGFKRGGTYDARTATVFGIQGGSGGGGGAGADAGNGGGGGGGAGGGVLVVFARNLVVVTNGGLSAAGGTGGNGNNHGGGGGGGGGGLVIVGYGAKAGAALTAAACAIQGAGGLGGVTGSAGTVGALLQMNLG